MLNNIQILNCEVFMFIKKIKVILSLLLVIVVLISCSESIAVSVPPHSICSINAMVLDVQKTRKEIVSDSVHSYVDYYAVRLKIYNSSVVRQSEYGVSCDNLINTEIDSIFLSTDIDLSTIKIGQDIIANIEFRGDERFNGNFLSDIKILHN